MILRRRRVALLIALGLAASACGDGTEEPAAAPDGATLVASTSIWADITSNVACGAPVEAIIPSGADPHSYEPSLRDRELVSRASLVVANGAGLEATTHDLLEAAIEEGVNVVEVATHIDLIDGDDEHGDDEHGDDEDGADEDGADEDEHQEEGGDEHAHDHGEGDPHVWQDPTRVAGVLDVIASALAAAGLDTCEESYRDELLGLDAEIAATFASIPIEERLLVTSHDSLAYFADRYGFEVVGTVIPSTSTMAESSAGQLAALAELIDERSVRAVFTDAFESASDAEALAGRIGIPVVPLVTGALTDEAPTYAGMMRSNAITIAEALAP